MKGNTANIGFINYDIYSTKLGDGRFFDFSLNSSTVTQKKMRLYRYDKIKEDEKSFFDEYFDGHFKDGYKERMDKLLLKVRNDI